MIERLNREVVAVMSTDEMKERMKVDGAEAHPTTPSEFGAMIRQDLAKWTPVVKASGITLN